MIDNNNNNDNKSQQHKRPSDTHELSKNWEELLSGFKQIGDEEIHNLSDLGLDEDAVLNTLRGSQDESESAKGEDAAQSKHASRSESEKQSASDSSRNSKSDTKASQNSKSAPASNSQNDTKDDSNPHETQTPLFFSKSSETKVQKENEAPRKGLSSHEGANADMGLTNDKKASADNITSVDDLLKEIEQDEIVDPFDTKTQRVKSSSGSNRNNYNSSSSGKDKLHMNAGSPDEIPETVDDLLAQIDTGEFVIYDSTAGSQSKKSQNPSRAARQAQYEKQAQFNNQFQPSSQSQGSAVNGMVNNNSNSNNISGKKRKRKPLWRKFVKAFMILILLCIVTGGGFTGYIILTSPTINPNNISDLLHEPSTIYDDTGAVLESVASSEVRENVTYDQLPPNLVYAVISIEDKTFFEHNGFNFVRIAGAIKESVTGGGDISGTSTITQQLSRNLYLSTERTLTRKIREAYYTIILEKSLTKDQIMETYLNTIPLGYNVYGAQAAANAYFGCDVSELTLAECATLAALPKSPTKYAPLKRYYTEEIEPGNPYILLQDATYTTVYDDSFKPRQELILKSMLDQGYITQADYEAAIAEDMMADMHPSETANSTVTSYFADYCIDDVVNDLMYTYGLDEESARDMISQKGLQIYSTLNVEMQAAAEDEFSKSSNFPSVTGIRKDSAGNILNPKNKNILLYARSNYFNSDDTFTLQPDEFVLEATGNLVILKDHRLNIFEVTGSSGSKVPQMEFKNMYINRNGIFYSINGGYITGIEDKYLSEDLDGNVVVDAQFFADKPDFFIMGTDTISIGPAHYTLRQETIQPQGAMVVTDYTNGQIKVMVGGRSLEGRLLYNRANNPRQPGSSIKPIAVYGPALQSGVDNNSGWTAGSTIEDSENIVNGKVWPKNSYSGYKGWVTLRTCVEQSINVCSVRLAQDIGFDYSIRYLQANGISSLVLTGDATDDNPAAIALGGMVKGISPVEMASAYGTFPNGGKYIAPTSYSKVTDSQGNIILESAADGKQVYNEGVAFIMTDILRTTVTNGIAGRAAIGTQPVGGKTGTTTDNVDAWFVGFTPQFSASVWIGNDVNIELSQGSRAAAMLWSKAMKRVTSGFDRGTFAPMPANVYQRYGEYYVDGTSPTGHRLGGGSSGSSSYHSSSGSSSSGSSNSGNTDDNTDSGSNSSGTSTGNDSGSSSSSSGSSGTTTTPDDTSSSGSGTGSSGSGSESGTGSGSGTDSGTSSGSGSGTSSPSQSDPSTPASGVVNDE